MSYERQLTDIALGQELWAEATFEMLQEGWDVAEQAEFYGMALAEAVLRHELDINDLRTMVDEANELDKEAVEASGGDIENLRDADYFEASARRIGHHAAKFGYQLTKSEERRYIQGLRYVRRMSLIGEGTEARLQVFGSATRGYPDLSNFGRS